MSEEKSNMPEPDASAGSSDEKVSSLVAINTGNPHPDDRPVDVERGRELYHKAREIITDYRDRILPGLPLGEKTRAAMTDICNDLVERPGGVQVYSNNQGRFASERMPHHMELAPNRVDSKALEIAEAVEKAGLKLTPEQCTDLAEHSLVYHELGHGLQRAYGRAAQPHSELNGHGLKFPAKADLTADTVRWGLAEPLFKDPAMFREFGGTVDGERLPVGLEQMLTAEYTQRTYGLSAHDAEYLRVNLTPSYRHEAVAAAQPIIAEHIEQLKSGRMGKTEIDAILLEEANTGIKALGYAAPLDPRTLQKVMNHTAEWESISGEERYYRHGAAVVERWRGLKEKWDEEGLPSSPLNSPRSGVSHSVGVYDIDVEAILSAGGARNSCMIRNQVDGEAIVRAAAAVEATGSTEPVKVPAITFARALNGRIYMYVNRGFGSDPVPEVAREVLIAALSGRQKVRAEVILDEAHLESAEGQAFISSLGKPLQVDHS